MCNFKNNFLKLIVLNIFTFPLMIQGSHDLLRNSWSMERGRSFAHALNGLRLLCFCCSYPLLMGFSVCFHRETVISHFARLSLLPSQLACRLTNQIDSLLGLQWVESYELSALMTHHLESGAINSETDIHI